jgi:hypothetical protein
MLKILHRKCWCALHLCRSCGADSKSPEYLFPKPWARECSATKVKNLGISSRQTFSVASWRATRLGRTTERQPSFKAELTERHHFQQERQRSVTLDKTNLASLLTKRLKRHFQQKRQRSVTLDKITKASLSTRKIEASLKVKVTEHQERQKPAR